MSRTTNDSEDGMVSKYQNESPLIDEGNGGSNSSGIILKKGPWTSSEDAILVEYVKKHGEGNWNAVQKHSGLSRCGKSCRLRWANHLRPNLKKGAFTPEEEATILELHAKIGNKWARMASCMPGRTDNEIKNYWNTRVKRRQRAGLPLYPPDLCLQVLQENQQGQNAGAMGCGDLGKHDPLQANSFEIPDVVFDGLKRTSDVYSYVSELPDVSTALLKSMASSQYYGFASQTIQRQKRLRGSSDVFPDASGCVQNGYQPQMNQFHTDTSHKISCSFGHTFQQDLDPGQSLLSFDATQGVHSLPNGNLSASVPTNVAVKSELPSLQYQGADLSTWGTSSPLPFLESTDAYIQSPPQCNAFESDCLAPRNSGLLDDLIHEAHHLSSGKKHLAELSSNSSSFTAGDMVDPLLNIRETEWDGVRVPTSPLGHSVNSVLNECISPCGSSLEDTPAAETFVGSRVKPEPVDVKKELKSQMDLVRPDALLGSDWFDCVGFINKSHDAVSDAIATFLVDDIGVDCNGGGSGSSSLSQEWGYDRCTWNSMPSAVSKMSNRH